MTDLTIGRLAAATGVKVETIRYYERAGLIAPPARTGGNYRSYSTGDLDRLRFIRKTRDLGFTLEEIRAMLDLARQRDRSCDTIDAIASDHQPRDADDKRLPFAQASPGGAGLATLLGVTLAQVHGGALPLAQAIGLLTHRPAALLGSAAGTLAKGAPADLCLFHPERIWQVEAGELPGKAQNTPFDGRALEGRVLGTWKAGRRVFG